MEDKIKPALLADDVTAEAMFRYANGRPQQEADVTSIFLRRPSRSSSPSAITSGKVRTRAPRLGNTAPLRRVLSERSEPGEVVMRRMWRGIISFFVEALQDDKKPIGQRKREAAAREQRWNRDASGAG
jgi:hypothetical protein